MLVDRKLSLIPCGEWIFSPAILERPVLSTAGKQHMQSRVARLGYRVVAFVALGMSVMVAGLTLAQPKPAAKVPTPADPPVVKSAVAPPGSPAATRSLKTPYLPAPAQKFGGEINLNANESKPYWPATVVPPKGAPNVLLIMTDDVGFGAPSTFGGVIPTPTMDRIAKAGLRYNMFHSTALCSPTRAALITGRNHHSVHTGVITELATGYPGYDSLFGKDTATIAEPLRQNGYGTSWFGKNHNVPAFQSSQSGPFDMWPQAQGFEYFYGFIGGDTSQWQPNLFRNTTPIEPFVGKPGWNLTTAQADEAISWLNQLNELAPDKPFFCYYVPGGTHAPHHPTPEWIKKFEGKFDEGWNVLRERIFANQKKLGVIPADTKLTPWPKDLLPEWETLNADEKKMFARQAEVYAAYLAYTDYEIGRVVQAVEDMGKLDNTLIIYISGDNGSSAEGTPIGTPNEVASFNGALVPVEAQLKNFYDVWGSDKTYPHMSVAWSWALDTPFKWTKQVASHFGGTRQGMVMSWPNRIKDVGGLRSQFHHVIDIVPTIYEAVGIEQPVEVNGVPQRPIEGVSMAYTWANADAPSTRKTQYFEMFGNRALYHEGWVALTTPINPPWDLTKPAPLDVANGFTWELYNVEKDFSEFENLAEAEPGKLRALQELFLVEAAKYHVLPMDASLSARLLTPRPSTVAGKTSFTYRGERAGIPHNCAPSLLDKSYTLTAEVEVPEGGGEGMINTQGGRFGGYGFYLLKGKPTFVWNLFDLARIRWQGKEALKPGKHTLVFDFSYDGPGIGKGGTGILKVDGKEVAKETMKQTAPFILQWDETFDVGVDSGTPVDDADYQVPFAFTGKLTKFTIDLQPPPRKPAEVKVLQDKNGKRD